MACVIARGLLRVCAGAETVEGQAGGSRVFQPALHLAASKVLVTTWQA